VTEAGLLAKPARQSKDVPDAISASSGSVIMGYETVDLPAWPIEADAGRVASVLEAIRAAIPERLAKDLPTGN
jgi:hypothetical protein